MKAIVIGATGLIGRELTSLLLSNDIYTEVVVFSRRSINLQHPKLKEHLIDFDQPHEWKNLVSGFVLFSTLGTTIKKAKTKENQYRIDYTYQYEFAKAAAQNDVRHLVLVSSSGANPDSKIFYSRIKGELEEAILQLPLPNITILRPSLLLGKRNEKRTGEALAQRIMPIVTRYIFRKYRPIPAKIVAKAMLNESVRPSGRKIYELNEIFDLAGE